MRHLRSFVASIGLCLGACGPALAAETVAPPPLMRSLVAPGSGAVRALVIGIDQYQHVNALRGAVADAHDIVAAFRRMGATDVTALIDRAADRAAVLTGLDALLARSQKGDLVVISLAGHGSKEDEHVKGSSRDGSDEVFLLVGFDPKTGPGGAEKILNHEFNHYIKAFEARGAQVIFVADTCYGGGLARQIALGSPEMSFRQVPRYRLAQDDFKPVSTPADAMLSELDFQHTTFMAAVDDETKAPEVLIDGQYRGALSYAVARAIEGAADQQGDGRITMRELFTYARKVVYQLSDERQNIVTMEPPNRDLDHEVVLELGAGGMARPAAAPRPEAPAPIEAAPEPIRLASTSGRVNALAGIAPLGVPFVVVSADAGPDVTWDPVAKEALAGGDTIALGIEAADLPGVVDRTAALRDIKKLVVASPQTIRLFPDGSLHHAGSRVDVEVADADQRALILLDVTGGGTVQMLYPTPRDRPVLDQATFRAPFKVRDPFGADEVVAITAAQRMPDLETALHDLDGRRSAGRLAATIARFGPPDMRVGVVGLFTLP
jgi:hypothetical protein